MNIHEKLPEINVPDNQTLRALPWKLKRTFKIKVSDTVQPAEAVEWGKDYSWLSVLNRMQGKFLELAGPTKQPENPERDIDNPQDIVLGPPRNIIDFSKYKNKTICTNVKSQAGVEVLADAAEVPFKNNAFKAVFVSSFRIEESARKLPKPADASVPDFENAEYIKRVAKETWRVLDDKGILIWLHLETEKELEAIEEAGFIRTFYRDTHYKNTNLHRYQVVFVKYAEAGKNVKNMQTETI